MLFVLIVVITVIVLLLVYCCLSKTQQEKLLPRTLSINTCILNLMNKTVYRFKLLIQKTAYLV